MTHIAPNESSSKPRRFLIGQLGSFGDCLYATAVARQIKSDYPDCHLTWAIGSVYRSILGNNPYIDDIWEIPVLNRDELISRWQEFESEALSREKRGDFDEIFLTQVFPGNLKNFDGTLRSSIFRAYNRPVTVPVAPVLHLFPGEVEHVRIFAEEHHLKAKKNVILFECSPKSGQSFVTLDFARKASKKIIERIPDTCIIISTNEPVNSDDERIIDGSMVPFRENAELSKYCTLLIGCSSGVSWLCTADWAKPLPEVQLLKKETCMYASFVHDHEYFGLPVDSIIEMTECTEDQLSECIAVIASEGFGTARIRYHQPLKLDFSYYATVISYALLRNHKYREAFSSLRYTIKRYGPRPGIFWAFFSVFVSYQKRRHTKSQN